MPPSTDRRFRSEWLLLAVLLALLAVGIAAYQAREHGRERHRQTAQLEAQARIVDDNLIRQLDGADKALRGIAKTIQAHGGRLDATALSRDLTLLVGAMPGVSGMLAQDADGTVVAATNAALIGANYAHRPFFRYPKQTADPDRLYVHPPFLTNRGTYVLAISRSLVDERGAFAGIVSASLDAEYFTVLLRSVMYAADMRGALAHSDDAVFLALPGDATRPPPPDARLKALLAAHKAGGGLPSTMSVPDPESAGRRLAAVRTIDRAEMRIDKPLLIALSRDLDAVLADWRMRTLELALAWFALAFGLSLALRRHQRRRRESRAIEEAVSRERQLGAERVEQALMGADLGLWELNVGDGTYVVNDRERRLLGYAPGEALPGAHGWRELIHPDDRARVDAAIVPHLKGEAPSYDCELRMRHTDGSYLWLFSRAMIVERDARGYAVRIVGTHLDITERKRNEARLAEATARLRENEEELRLITDNVPALVSRLDAAQRFRFANRAYADWLQIDPKALIGRTLCDLYGEAAYAAFRHRIERALSGVRVTYERDLTTPSGTRRVEFTLVPHFDSAGAVDGLFTLATDITGRHEAERKLARSEERLTLALEGSGLALFDWNLADQTIFHSAQTAEMRGEAAQATVTPIEEQQRHVHPEDLPQVLGHLRDAITGRTPRYSAEFRVRQADGQWRWQRARGRVVQRNVYGRAMRLAGTYADVHERKLDEVRLRHLAEFDALTGLPNRALFGDRLQQAMARAGRGRPMALLFLDVDHFKTINDTLGHEVGDAVLKVYARRMQETVRETDTVARLAGDEFTIILDAVRDANDASMIATKLVEALARPIPLADGPLRVTASVGVALLLPGETDEAALLRRADAALYEAKRRGRNSAFYAEPEPVVGIAA